MRLSLKALVWSVVLLAPATLGGHQRREQPCQRTVPGNVTEAGQLSRALLVETDWRLYSSGLSLQWEAGYPFRFHSDGSVETENIGSAERWRLEPDGLVSIRDGHDQIIYRLVYDSTYCIVRTADCDASGVLLLGPAGTDFWAYLVKRCPDNFQIYDPAAPPN